MSIYTEILAWSQNRPVFIKDALRRIISNPQIYQSDIDELILLLKKENGDPTVTINSIPLDGTHIPTSVTVGTSYPKLLSIKNPINISALYNSAHLQLNNIGLSVIYGNNGSGKSSYSRILKKLCWSRHPNIELKKNVFIPSLDHQQVEFLIEVDGLNTAFQWSESLPTHPSLGSIYVFDKDCADVYLNKENPTEYKPIGIDVLERLISVLNMMSHTLNVHVQVYNTQKPKLDPPLNPTASGQWYANIEIRSRIEVDNYIMFSEADVARKNEVYTLLNTQNPQQNIGNLKSLNDRVLNYIRQLKSIEDLFSDENIEDIKLLINKYRGVKQAYDIATAELSSLNLIDGFGSDPWRALWEAAKNFAHSNGMSDGTNFPSQASLKTCVLCQQDIDAAASHRLQSFSKFILNDVSKQLNSLQNSLLEKKLLYESVKAPPHENFIELTKHFPEFQIDYSAFCENVNSAKTLVKNYLDHGTEERIVRPLLSAKIAALISEIDRQLVQQNLLLQNRNALVIEFNELTARSFLWNEKANILQYFDEIQYKNWINRC